MAPALRRLALCAMLALLAGCQANSVRVDAPAGSETGEQSTEGTLPRGRLSFEGGPEISIEIASTMENIRLGLSYRESLCESCGLYFVFPDENIRTFWMRQMRFPIDIIWINHGKVIGVAADTQPEPGVPESQLATYHSPQPVRNVLEVPAGFAARHGIGAGTRVKVWAK